MRCLFILMLLSIAGCVDPPWIVGDAYLRGSRVKIEIEGGIDMKKPVGILLVENSQYLPVTERNDTRLESMSVNCRGHWVEVLYGEVIPEYFGDDARHYVSVESLTDWITQELPEGIVERINDGEVSCFLITEGIGSANHPKTDLIYWPRPIHIPDRGN